jgi:lipoprotein-releasing system ATP-binding protein
MSDHPEARTAQDGLHVRDLCKDYPAPDEPLHVLAGVDLDVSPGESVVVAGPSGSGKSTLLNLLGTLDEPTGGSVRLGGVDPFALSARALAAFRSRHVGFIFQDHHLLAQCTALENVLLPALALGRPDAAARQRAESLLERVGLADRAAHLPGELSGGQRQRVAVARALMNRPDLLLADEPTGNLDAHAAEAVGRLLAQLVADAGAMLVLATHDQELAALFGRRLLLRDGRLSDQTHA